MEESKAWIAAFSAMFAGENCPLTLYRAKIQPHRNRLQKRQQKGRKLWKRYHGNARRDCIPYFAECLCSTWAIDVGKAGAMLQRFIEVWCNGSISDFESAGEGSTPSISAQRCNKPQQTWTKRHFNSYFFLFFYKMTLIMRKLNNDEKVGTTRFFHTIFVRRDVKHAGRSTFDR